MNPTFKMWKKRVSKIPTWFWVLVIISVVLMLVLYTAVVHTYTFFVFLIPAVLFAMTSLLFFGGIHYGSSEIVVFSFGLFIISVFATFMCSLIRVDDKIFESNMNDQCYNQHVVKYFHENPKSTHISYIVHVTFKNTSCVSDGVKTQRDYAIGVN